MRFTLSHKAIVIVAVPLVFEVALLGTLLVLLNETQHQKREAEHAREIMQEADYLMRLHIDASAKLIQYGLTANKRVAEEYPKIMAEIPIQYQKLNSLTSNDQRQQLALSEMKPVIARVRTMLTEIKEALDSRRGSPAAFLQFGNRKAELTGTVGELKGLIDKYVEPELEIDRMAPIKAEQAAKSTIQVVYFGFAVNVAVAIFIALFFSRSIVTRLRVLSENSLRLAKEQALLPPLPGKDEIADVDRTFHSMAEALAAADLKEKEIEQLKQDFLNMVSHDLRTPISSVLNVMTMMSMGMYGNLNDEGQQRTRDVERELTRLLKLINDLLDIEKMQAGSFSLGVADAGLDDIVDRAVSAVDALAEKKGIELMVPASTDLVIKVDEDRLVQVLVNLLSNALKFSPPDEKISIGIDQSEDTVRISVTDRGRGVPADMQQSIFEKYKQVELSDSKQKGGTGLGLPICKAIIEQHGGQIGVTSNPGQGSTFWFTVPRSRQEPTEAAGIAASVPHKIH